ncbi:MAG: hypothetical protein RDU13_11970 [Elusimicrobiales bacterium]|nr:hypothetical protein [Elusimicrobiales bacterium]
MVKLLTLTCLLVSPGSAWADDALSVEVSSGPRKFTALESAAAIVAVEGLVWFNAAVAKNAPEIYGSALILLSPLSASPGANTYGVAVGIAATAGLGLYNILDADRNSKADKRRFWTTFIGIHAVGALATGMTALTGGKPPLPEIGKDRKASLFLVPGPDSLILAFNRRF